MQSCDPVFAHPVYTGRLMMKRKTPDLDVGRLLAATSFLLQQTSLKRQQAFERAPPCALLWEHSALQWPHDEVSLRTSFTGRALSSLVRSTIPFTPSILSFLP